MEAIVAALAVGATGTILGGVMWLVVKLPNMLDHMDKSLNAVLENQKQFEAKFNKLEDLVQGQEKRIIKLELTR